MMTEKATTLNKLSHNSGLTKVASKKAEAFISSAKFLSSEIVPCLCKSCIWLHMVYCCHVWAGAPNCCLNITYCNNHHVGLLVLHTAKTLAKHGMEWVTEPLNTQQPTPTPHHIKKTRTPPILNICNLPPSSRSFYCPFVPELWTTIQLQANNSKKGI